MQIFSENRQSGSMLGDLYNKISQHTGLSQKSIEKILQKNLLLQGFNVGDKTYIKAVEDYFFRNSKMLTTQEYQKDFLDYLDAHHDENDKNKIANDFIKLLDKSIDNFDTAHTLSVVKELLLFVNQKDKEKLSTLFSVVDNSITNEKLSQLNESVDFHYTNTQVDYGTLRDLLTKNNKRWGVSNEIKNSHQRIVEYINEKIIEKDNAEIVTVDNKFHLELLQQYCDGVINPINRNYDSSKFLISSVQPIIFDMVIIVNHYINNSNVESYLKPESVKTYKVVSEKLIELIYSSLPETKILNKFFVEDWINNKVVDNDRRPIDTFSYMIDERYINLKGLNATKLIPMVDYIMSTNVDFNLQIRSVIKQFVNVSRELLISIDKVKTKLINNKI